MEPSGRNGWQLVANGTVAKRLKQAINHCRRLRLRLPESFHGKEGVDGSSPSEGPAKAPQNGTFLSA